MNTNKIINKDRVISLGLIGGESKRIVISQSITKNEKTTFQTNIKVENFSDINGNNEKV